MNSRSKSPVTFLLLALVFALAGCRPVSPDDKINARDDAGFDLWISQRADFLTPDDVRELNEARQMLRYEVMQSHPGLSEEDQAAAVYAEIAGKTRRELLLAGYDLQVQRVNVELANYRLMLEKFQHYGGGHPLDEADKKYVADSLAKIQGLMAQRQETLARLTKRVAELKQPAAPR